MTIKNKRKRIYNIRKYCNYMSIMRNTYKVTGHAQYPLTLKDCYDYQEQEKSTV